MFYQLVGDVGVVLTCHALTDGRLHQTAERWQDVDRRVDLSVVKLSVYVDLPFCDVSGQIRDRMSNIYTHKDTAQDSVN